jgi:hypothetical protein
LYFRNGIDVEGASHKQVVDLIKHSTDELHLVGTKDKIHLNENVFCIFKLLLPLVMKKRVIYIMVKNQVEVQMIIQNDDH